jgi:hypothetical protein
MYDFGISDKFFYPYIIAAMLRDCLFFSGVNQIIQVHNTLH